MFAGLSYQLNRHNIDVPSAEHQLRRHTLDASSREYRQNDGDAEAEYQLRRHRDQALSFAAGYQLRRRGFLMSSEGSAKYHHERQLTETSSSSETEYQLRRQVDGADDASPAKVVYE